MSGFRYSTTPATLGGIALLSLAGCGSTPHVETQRLAPHIRLYDISKTPKSEQTLTIQDDGEPHTPQTVSRIGPNEFLVTCPGFKRVSVAQQTDVWCWAACAAMVQEYNTGQPADQAAIAARMHGKIDPTATDSERRKQARTAGYEEIIRALAPDVPEPLLRDATLAILSRMTGESTKLDLGDYAESQAMRNLTNSDIMIDDLLRSEPVVVGMRNFETDEAYEQARAAAEARGENADAITWGHVRVVYSARVAVAHRSFLDNLKGTTQKGKDKIGDVFGKNDDAPDAERIFHYADKWENRLPRKYDLHEVTAMNPLPSQRHEPGMAWEETIPGPELATKIVFMISAREARAILEQEGYIKTE